MKTPELDDDQVAKMEGLVPPDDFDGDGCTWAPDYIGGADLRPACHFHDYAYRTGGCRRGRENADRRFYRNLLTCGVGRFWANVYFRRVRLFGARLYRYQHGKPKGFWDWTVIHVSDFFGRYFKW